MSVPSGYRFTKEHEWLSESSAGKFKIGITDYAQAELGDVVFIDLPEIGRAVKKGESMATVESVKAVSDIYAPIDGKVIEVNSTLSTKPELVNQEPHETGWMVVLEASEPSQSAQLLDASAYEGYLKEIAK